jgi:hypothetical protein
MLKTILSNLKHLFIVGLLAIVGYLAGHVLLTTWFAVIFFMGREHAQAEYRWVKKFGGKPFHGKVYRY